MSESIESIKEILENHGFESCGTSKGLTDNHVSHDFKHTSIAGAESSVYEALGSGFEGSAQSFTLKGSVPYSEGLRDAVNGFTGGGWIGGFLPFAGEEIYEMKLSCHPGSGLDFCDRFVAAMVEQLSQSKSLEAP